MNYEIDIRYEKRSTILTTNINFKAEDEVFQDTKLIHHATAVSIVGQSYRIKDHFSKEKE